MTEYGAKGCRCWPEDELDVSTGLDGFITRIPGRWMPNASCPHHGLLAGMLAPRTDTGVYRVVSAPDAVYGEVEEAEAARAEECPPGVHSMFDFCPGRATCEEGYPIEDPLRPMTTEEAKTISEAMRDPDAPTRRLPPRPTTEKEHGDLSTVRRWLRRFADWLDPHAAAVRDYRADWRRQCTDLDGGEPRDQGWER